MVNLRKGRQDYPHYSYHLPLQSYYWTPWHRIPRCRFYMDCTSTTSNPRNTEIKVLSNDDGVMNFVLIEFLMVPLPLHNIIFLTYPIYHIKTQEEKWKEHQKQYVQFCMRYVFFLPLPSSTANLLYPSFL